MRNKILSFMLIIGLLTSLFTTFPAIANASGDMPVGISSTDYAYLDGELTVTVNFDYVNEAGVVYLALYDNGKFAYLTQETLTVGDTEVTLGMTCENEEEDFVTFDTKIMCWGGDNLLTPISAEVEIPEIIRRLCAVSCEIDKFTTGSNRTYFTSQERVGIMLPIKECIDEAVAEYEYELVNQGADFIKTQYETQIAEVQGVYDDLVASGKDGTFKGKLAEFTTENLVWLAEFFNIDITEYTDI